MSTTCALLNAEHHLRCREEKYNGQTHATLYELRFVIGYGLASLDQNGATNKVVLE